MRLKAFWFHYNKPASARAKKPQVTVHYDNACHILDNVDIHGVRLSGRIRKTQPRYVLAGKCSSFRIVDNVAVIE